MPKFFIKTYGCQMNERDSEQVARSLLDRGYERGGERSGGRRRAAQHLQRARHGGPKGARQNGDARPDREATGRRWSSVFSAAWRRRAATELLELAAARRSRRRHAKISSRRRLRGRAASSRKRARARRWTIRVSRSSTSAEEAGSQETIRDHVLEPRQATAFVSIMQGCNMHCTFCIVPRTRGAERSRAIDEIVGEVRELVERGREGSHAARPDRESLRPARISRSVDGKSPFVQLLEAVHAVDGLERLRFTSPHPIGFRDDLIAALRANCRSSCEHVHLPLQSGSNRILKAMHRPTRRRNICAWSISIRAARAGHRPHHRCDRRLSRRRRRRITRRRATLVEQVAIRQRLRLSLFAAAETPAAEMARADRRAR